MAKISGPLMSLHASGPVGYAEFKRAPFGAIASERSTSGAHRTGRQLAAASCLSLINRYWREDPDGSKHTWLALGLSPAETRLRFIAAAQAMVTCTQITNPDAVYAQLHYCRPSDDSGYPANPQDFVLELPGEAPGDVYAWMPGAPTAYMYASVYRWPSFGHRTLPHPSKYISQAGINPDVMEALVWIDRIYPTEAWALKIFDMRNWTVCAFRQWLFHDGTLVAQTG